MCSLLFVVVIERLGEKNLHETICEEGNLTIVLFIWQHHVTLVILYHYETHLMFQSPTKTRFANDFLMIE